jgi:hypothetical protein
MRADLNRRTFVTGITAATAVTAVGITGRAALQTPAAAGAAPPTHQGHAPLDRSAFRYTTGEPGYRPRGRALRKSASAMSRSEIDRFVRAFTWAVSRGYLDVFSDEHYDHARHRQHGADVLAQAPPAVKPGEGPAWGFRLLPWHRAFLLEAEAMLRAALHDRNRHERRDPREADLVFLPYWDATHDQRLPRWVERLQPRGGTAIVPPDLPPGHAGYGRPVGSRYRIDFLRRPGSWLVFDKLPQPDQIGRIMANPLFPAFYAGIDLLPERVDAQIPAAAAALAALARKLPGNPHLAIVLAATDPAYPRDPESQLRAFNAFLAIGHLASVEAAKRDPDRELIALIRTVYSVFRFQPHILLHFWAGGLDARNPNVRGTVTYFNELCVDPAFWMLHGELDRIWYSWERTHPGEVPPLDKDDAVFQPLLPSEGAWYGGGHTYQLAELLDHRGLAYRYDRPFTV